MFWTSDRVPNLVDSAAQPVLSSSPRIEIVLHHVHTIDGKDAGGTATDATYEKFKESLERVRAKTPFLAGSGSGIPKPDYVLDLQSEVAEHGKTGAIVSGATLLLIPAFPRSEVIVRGTLKDAAGSPVGQYDASAQVKGVIQLLLIVALPVVPFVSPGDELYDDTLRDVFLLMEKDLVARATP